GNDYQDLLYLSFRKPIVVRFHMRVEGQGVRAWQAELAKRMFADLDQDQNGKLDDKELAGAPSPQMIAAATQQVVSASPIAPATSAAVAAPASKQLPRTVEDLSAMLFSHAGPMFQVSTSNGNQNATFAIVDGVYRQLTADPELFIKALDADRDGRISDAEFQDPARIFQRIDADDDETISRLEAYGLANPTQQAVATGPVTSLST